MNYWLEEEEKEFKVRFLREKLDNYFRKVGLNEYLDDFNRSKLDELITSSETYQRELGIFNGLLRSNNSGK